jgi:endonuclease/exonuclease/phosphatase family metal-dependent hydrolase
VVALRYYGEQRPLLTVALYVPRFPFALPLPVLATAAFRTGERRSLALVAAAGGVALVPLMGLTLSWPAENAQAGTIRILSYNTDLGQRGSDIVHRQVVDARPDIVLFQMTGRRTIDYFADHPLEGYVVQRTGEFWVASRFPIVDVFEPRSLGGDPRISANFVRYTIETPLGRLDVYSIHPESPRGGLETLWERGSSAEPASGGLPAANWASLEMNTRVRERQVRAVAEHARLAVNPVVIAGDTNLPGLSSMLTRYLGSYQDGFARAGRGFGYTFPAHEPIAWMRLDRILVGPALRFVHFEVGRRRASTHYCVIADLARADATGAPAPP